MSNKITGNEPYFPHEQPAPSLENAYYGHSYSGVTIRTQLAAMAMQGLCEIEFQEANGHDFDKYIRVSRKAVKCADVLIRTLNETPNTNE